MLSVAELPPDTATCTTVAQPSSSPIHRITRATESLPLCRRWGYQVKAPTDMQLRISIGEKFVRNSDLIQVDYDASNYRASASAYVDRDSGPTLKAKVQLYDIGRKYGTQNFRIIKWNNRCMELLHLLINSTKKEAPAHSRLQEAGDCSCRTTTTA